MGVRTPVFAVVLLVVGPWLGACSSPCQRLCVTLADRARECGVEIPQAEVDACIDEQADSDQQASCRRVGDPDTVAQEWTCDDVEAFFAGS